MAYDYWRPYVSVAQQRASAKREMSKLRKQGVDVFPIEIEGQKIARTFWGQAWCEHLEHFSDYANRLPRGKRYVRNGSVCHLEIDKGEINAIVSGSDLYAIKVVIKPLPKQRWKAMQKACTGEIGSMLELLQGRLSDNVMQVVTHQQTGLFPQPREIKLDCNCPDWAHLCKHLAAVLYGVGALLDKQPELLFKLRGVDHEALVSTDIILPKGSGKRRRLDSNVSDIFGVEFDTNDAKSGSQLDSKTTAKKKRAPARKAAKNPPGRAKAGRSTRKKTFTPSSASVSRLRKRLQLNCTQFAQLIGVSSASVTAWENKGGSLNLQYRSIQALELANDLEKADAWKKLGLI